MALLLRHEDVLQTVDMTDAIGAMETAFREEGEGGTILPQRINMKTDHGWLRVGPVALQKSGWMGFKAMNFAPGQGVRYQVHLYRMEDGELLSVMDAQHLTTLRTGATSAVATRRLARHGAGVVAVLGSSAEAAAQLEAMQAMGCVASAKVFSPTAANRKRLAEDFRHRHTMNIDDVDSAEAAVDGADIIVAAVRSAEPVLLGRWLRPGMHVNSVGTARRDQREVDAEVFRRSSCVVVDSRQGVCEEAGDVYAVRETFNFTDVVELSALVSAGENGRKSDHDITLFKSVGTGIQDIALAALIYERAKERGIGTDFGVFPHLKN